MHHKKKSSVLRQRRIRGLRILQASKKMKLPQLIIIQHDDYIGINNLRQINRPFKVQFKNVDVLKWFTKPESNVSDVKDLIPQQSVNNLDIIASSNEKFQGSDAAKDMVTMSYDDYTSYTGDLNLYLAQIALYKKQTEEDIEFIGQIQNKEIVLQQLNESQLQETPIQIPPQYHDGLPLNSVNLWASRGSADSGFHYDSYDNFLVLLKGQKIIWLIQENSRWESWQTVWEEGYNHLKSHAKFLSKQQRYITLNQNEMIFIPQGWLHRVISISDSVAINIWFGGITHSQINPSYFQLRFLLNEMNKKQMDMNLKKLVADNIAKIPSRKHNFYRTIAREKQFNKVSFLSRYRTIKSDSYQSQISSLVMFLYSEPSVNTVELLRLIMSKFGKNTESILKLLAPLCLLIITIKLSEFTQKNQFILGNNLFQDFKDQQKEKIEYREKFFDEFWAFVSPGFLDEMETLQQKFCKQQMMTMVTQHIM